MRIFRIEKDLKDPSALHHSFQKASGANANRSEPVQQTGELLAILRIINRRKGIEMLSRDCDGCSQMRACNRRFVIAYKGEKVYCPDGTAHLVDGF